MQPGYKTIHGFLWPESDIACHRVVFGEVAKLKTVIGLCRDRRVVIQAGGNCGVFPAHLAEHFKLVYTFEPEHGNFAALVHNTVLYPNVIKMQAALGNKRSPVTLKIDEGNCGATHAVASAEGTIPTVLIDDLGLSVCDLIYLDIEGFEAAAISGAHETIKRYRPIIAIEDKGLQGTHPGALPERICSTYDYQIHSKMQRDVILVPVESHEADS